MSYTVIDNYIYSVWSILCRKYGVDAANRDLAPLRWYAQTARASVAFLNALVEAKPFMIARKLHMGGSYDDTIERIKRYLGVA